MRKRRNRAKAAAHVPPVEVNVTHAAPPDAAAGTDGKPERIPPPMPAVVAARPPLPDDKRCAHHAKVPAIAVCDTCGAYMCATCIFEVPGGMHMCPVCAMAPKIQLSKSRKTAMAFAYVLAVISTIGMLLLLLGALAPLYTEISVQLVAVIVERLLTFFPALAGVACSVGVMDQKLGNPTALWVAAIWNTILLVAYLVVLFIAIVLL
jgi:hypothetical protein